MQIQADERALRAAIHVLASQGPQALEGFDQAIYTTDAAGRIDGHNSAAARLAGRTPRIGHDLWVVSHQIFDLAGALVEPASCSMATAISDRRPVRGVESYLEKPDGERRRVRPYPSPRFDRGGAFIGGISLLADVTDRPSPGAHSKPNGFKLEARPLGFMFGAIIEDCLVEWDCAPGRMRPELIGKVCVLWLENGRMVSKRPFPAESGIAGEYDLTSSHGPTVLGVRIAQAAPLARMTTGGAVRAAARAARQSLN